MSNNSLSIHFKLIPRFNYSLTFINVLKSISFLFRKIDFKYQKYIVEYFKNENIFFVNNARTGLRLLLSAISSKKLKVGVQAYTCHTIFQAINNASHEIVFIDIDGTYNIDLNDLKKKIDIIDVLIVTHTFGIPVDFDEIKSLAKDKIIIEDCAHGLFAKYKGRPVGTLGDASIFSFGFGKYPPIGQGGMVVINNLNKYPFFQNNLNKLSHENILAEIINYLKRLFLSIIFIPGIYGIITFPIGKKIDIKIDFTNKFKFNESKGFLIDRLTFIKEFERFENLSSLQRNNALFIAEHIKKIFEVILEDNFKKYNYYIFPLMLTDRDKAYSYLIKKGIEGGKHFHKSIDWAIKFGYKSFDCPNAEKATREVLTIPVHHYLSEKKLLFIINILQEFHKLYIHT
ncbi:MAG: DegT/DnrJ/EryC1/StrS family aminotransferase [Bacteroidetes bacterium]|nr:DegT/DnrJ/EryC1/StrS family aminotransferase [Bacteroidota bacterium]